LSKGSKQDSETEQLCDEAFELMERAQTLLDQAGMMQAAAHLDHAISCIPDATGIFPRRRKNTPPEF
jgi:hypothetical protein